VRLGGYIRFRYSRPDRSIYGGATVTEGLLDADHLRRLMAVGRGLVSNLDLESVLQQLIEVGRELTGARYAALGILDSDRRELERFLAVGIDPATRERIGDLPRGRGVLGELIRDARPLRLENVGDHPRSYGFPPGHPPMTTFLGVPVMIRGEAFGNLYLTEKQAGPFDEVDEETATILADFAAIAIQNARLYQDAESRSRELEEVVRRLEATAEIVRALDGDTDLRQTLELIAKRGRALVDAAWLLILLEDRGELQVSAVAGDMDRDILGSRLPFAGSVSEQVMRARLPQRITDLSGALTVGPVRAPPGSGAALFVPMIFRARQLGVMIVSDGREAAPLSSDDQRLLLAFAAGAANAVHSAKSVEADRLRLSIDAAEQERSRWARELHDETLQGLGGLQVLLSSALRGPPKGLAEAVRSAIEHIVVEISSLRSLITELRPAALDELGLPAAIETLALRTAETQDLTVETNIELGLESPARLPAEAESTLYRLAQEALTNVTKHAGARHVEISLKWSDSDLELKVSDDGRGFDPTEPAEGLGLMGMRERVALAGGKLEVSSQHGAGTALRALIPVDGQAKGVSSAAG
jgi:signal transduction histidine kinase